jgi:hypothetical protein
MSRETSAALAVAGVGHLEKHTLEAEMRSRECEHRARQPAAHREAGLFSLDFAFSLTPAADTGRFGIDFLRSLCTMCICTKSSTLLAQEDELCLGAAL